MNVEAIACDCRTLDVIHLGADSAIEPEFKRLAAGEVAWDSRIANGKILVIKEGLVRVYHGDSQGRQRLSHLLGPSHWLGVDMIAGVDGKTRAVAATSALVALVDAQRVVDAALSRPESARALLQQITRQLIAAREQITESQNLDCTSRVIHALLRLSDCGAGQPTADNSGITLPLTQQDVADAVGIARETVNAVLQKLAESNLIRKQRGKITIDVAALKNRPTEAAVGSTQL